MKKEKVVLAYSGGLDTTAIIPWLKEHFDYDVVCCCIDCGQGNELDNLEERAKLSGAAKLYILDVNDEFAEEYIMPCVKAGAVYENKYLLGTSMARPLIAKKLVEIARKEKAVAEGLMFDLMYVNQQYYRQYAFIRKADRQMLLIVANFDDVPVSMSLTIPSHAFDYLSIAEGTYPCTDLLTGTPTELPLPRDAPVTLHLLPRQSVVLKL